mmetsp:Transcript_96150/g.206287  ORF Transcript_96150/g.206287 Transcript_96150/m.206287 type:complete len:308 (-) Transcript_96150:900-1823(-)
MAKAHKAHSHGLQLLSEHQETQRGLELLRIRRFGLVRPIILALPLGFAASSRRLPLDGGSTEIRGQAAQRATGSERAEGAPVAADKAGARVGAHLIFPSHDGADWMDLIACDTGLRAAVVVIVVHTIMRGHHGEAARLRLVNMTMVLELPPPARRPGSKARALDLAAEPGSALLEIADFPQESVLHGATVDLGPADEEVILRGAVLNLLGVMPQAVLVVIQCLVQLPQMVDKLVHLQHDLVFHRFKILGHEIDVRNDHRLSVLRFSFLAERLQLLHDVVCGLLPTPLHIQGGLVGATELPSELGLLL